MKTWNFSLIKVTGVSLLIFFSVCGRLPAQDLTTSETAKIDTTSNLGAAASTNQSEIFEPIIRDRMRDYDGILAGEYGAQIIKWNETFLNARQTAMTSAVQEMVALSDKLQKTKRIDATEVKQRDEFKSLLTNKVTEVLNAPEMKAQLREWAKNVELITRTRMIECFQQIIAEDLGQVFDQKLSNQVVQAVRAIPVDELVADRSSSSKIEQSILAALPESALSADDRKALAQAAASLAYDATYAYVSAQAAPTMVAPLAAKVAEQSVQASFKNGLYELNQQITDKPDLDAIHSAFEGALRDWNAEKLDPLLEPILAKFRKQVIHQVEEAARKQSQTFLP